MTKKFNNTLYQTAIKHVLGIIFLSIIFISTTSTCLAEGPTGGNWWTTAQQGGLNQVGQAYGGGQPRDARIVVVDMIKIILGFLGIIAVVLILYAGFKWMLSRGNEETVSDAKKILIAGVIGLAIILSAYIIANFIINQIYSATTGTPVLFP